jgi:hypothetical protein
MENLEEWLRYSTQSNFKNVAFLTCIASYSFIEMTKSMMQTKLIILYLLNFPTKTRILFYTKQSLLACFMVPVELIDLMHLAWWTEGVANVIPKSSMNTLSMERMVILNMPGQTMDVQCRKMVISMTTDM